MTIPVVTITQATATESGLIAKLRKLVDRLNVENKVLREAEPSRANGQYHTMVAAGYLAELRLCRRIIAGQRVELARLQGVAQRGQGR
jgi:hypothetical protein